MNDEDDVNSSEGPIDRALRRGLQTEALSAEALNRIRSATESEWRRVARNAGPQRFWSGYAAAAAAIVLLAFVAGWMGMDRSATPALVAAVGRLERADYPGVIQRNRWSRDRVISNGEKITEGQDILVRGGARIALVEGGSLRVATGTNLKVISDQMIKLVDGSIYVDVPPAFTRKTRLIIQTPAGTFTHLGTQFQVAVYDGQTQVRVREGQVNWHSSAGDSVTGAGVELLIDKRGNVTRSQLSTTGSDWGWAEVLAAPFVIENRSLAEFLQHVARETGRKLVFESPAVERRATSTVLHGSTDRLNTVEALSAVMATTSLRFALNAESIHIESEGDSKKIR